MHSEDTLSQRLAELSPAKRLLLEKRLKQSSVSERAIDRIPHSVEQGPTPASFAQQRLWFLQQLAPESTLYNEVVAIRLRGPLNREALARASQEIMQRHEILGSTFAQIDGVVMQIPEAEKASTSEVSFIDLSDLPAIEREAAAQHYIHQEIQRPFQLDQDLPWRRAIVRLDENEHIAFAIMHHIVTDAWSMEIFVRELTMLYAAFSAGLPSPLPPVPVYYTDYARWQRQWLASGVASEQSSYWQKQLAAPLPVLALPTDFPRPAVQGYHGRRLPVRLPAPLSQDLRALSQQEGVTLFMTLLAAFQLLLSRYSGQEDILVGSPIANRGRPELEQVMGCFVNTLVLRTDLSGAPSFRALLQRVRAVTLAAYDHQDVPFEQLVEVLQPARSMSYSPLFQVFMTLQNVPQAEQKLADLRISSYEVEHSTAKFDLLLNLYEQDQEIAGFLEYDSDLFAEPSMLRLLGHFQILLEALVQYPEQSVTSVPLLTSREWQELRQWNETAVAYPEAGLLLHQLIEAQVDRSPQAVAVRLDRDTLTYAQLNARANQLAHALRARGVGPERRVGVCMPRSLSLVVSLLAILKAGGAYVPLDPEYPLARLRFLLEDARVELVLTQQVLTPVLADSGAPVLVVDQEPSDGQSFPECNLEVAGSPEQLAYVIYTSGSTGEPKGAMNSQRAIVNRLLWMQQRYGLQPQDRVLQKTASSFDVSVWEFFWPLLAGAQLVLARPGGQRESRYLCEVMREAQISVVHFVPSMLRAWLEESGVEQVRSLCLLICSGEALPGELARACQQRLPWVALQNLYGPTEAAVDVTAWSCEVGTGEEVSPGGSVPIGQPIANVQTYVLDQQMQPVPVGVSGELYLGGVAVGRGYLSRAALTAERFVPDPFGAWAGGRLYRTGDVVRRREDGSLVYLGRNDQQIKLRGYRVELGEIEAALRQHEGIKEAVVVAREERLVGYVVLEQGQELRRRELVAWLEERLPAYMVPRTLFSVKTLPHSPNGKLDRLALPSLNENQLQAEIEYVAPNTPVEKEMVTIWCQLLGVPRIGVRDNFFEMGGHSLLVTQLVARIRDVFQVDLPMRMLFKVSTIAELAEIIEKMQARNLELRKPGVEAVSRQNYRLYKLMPKTAATGTETKVEG